jgi:hypothetical protein
MQTLNVGAGRTDEEYKAAEEQRRADLLADSRSCANYFFVAAGLAVLGTGLLGLRLGAFVNIGAIDLLGVYGGQLVRHNPILVYGAAAAWITLLGILGLAAHVGHRGAFIAGVVLYSADMVALGILFSLWAIGVHGFFVMKWFQAQRMLQELKQPGVIATAQAGGA